MSKNVNLLQQCETTVIALIIVCCLGDGHCIGPTCSYPYEQEI